MEATDDYELWADAKWFAFDKEYWGDPEREQRLVRAPTTRLRLPRRRPRGAPGRLRPPWDPLGRRRRDAEVLGCRR